MTSQNNQVFIGIDLGGTTIKGALVDNEGGILYETRVDTEKVESEKLLTQIIEFANALQKQNETGEARKNYDEVIEKSYVNSLRSGSNYNKGIAYLKEKDLLNAAASFKECLKQDPNDDSARENLQKALNELKKQQQQNQPQQKQKQQKQKQQKNQPLNKDMMQQKFNELRNQEKQLQQKLQSKTTANQPEKDW